MNIMVFDTETINLDKPFIYNIGYAIYNTDAAEILAMKDFVVEQVWHNPMLFVTAYYASKRCVYLEKLAKGEITLTDWKTASAELVEDMDACVAVGAYNSMFDYKKAIPFTDLYISKLYSPDFHDWLNFQNKKLPWLATGHRNENPNGFDETIFRFRGKEYPLFDLWGLSCRHILNCDEYKNMCLDNDWQTASGKYFKTSAETAFRFFSETLDFEEAHTAIDDAEIESILFAEICKRTKKKFEMGIIYFPFRELGTVEDFILNVRGIM